MRPGNGPGAWDGPGRWGRTGEAWERRRLQPVAPPPLLLLLPLPPGAACSPLLAPPPMLLAANCLPAGRSPAMCRIIRNSWGTFWGQLGFFKLERGVNALQIEAGDCWWAMLPGWLGAKSTMSATICPGSYEFGLAEELACLLATTHCVAQVCAAHLGRRARRARGPQGATPHPCSPGSCRRVGLLSCLSADTKRAAPSHAPSAPQVGTMWGVFDKEEAEKFKPEPGTKPHKKKERQEKEDTSVDREDEDSSRANDAEQEGRVRREPSVWSRLRSEAQESLRLLNGVLE